MKAKMFVIGFDLVKDGLKIEAMEGEISKSGRTFKVLPASITGFRSKLDVVSSLEKHPKRHFVSYCFADRGAAETVLRDHLSFQISECERQLKGLRERLASLARESC